MAAMTFRESNQVKWVGVRPGHNGTQILARTAANNSTNIVYTVTAGKTLFLHSYQLNISCGTNNIAFNMYIRTDAAVTWHQVSYGKSYASKNNMTCQSFNPPLEIPAEYQIMIQAGADLWAYCCIQGWEEDD